jgi:hypothetical protein
MCEIAMASSRAHHAASANPGRQAVVLDNNGA